MKGDQKQIELLRVKESIISLQEEAIEDFDFENIFRVHEDARNFFEKWDNMEGVELMDRMTAVVKNLKVLVDLVSSRRASVEAYKQEIDDYKKELHETTKLLDDWTDL